ncbi:MAG: hypothetical protein E7515_01540 [Ruminococcaceae bacterium]|nr:hypothetical protein [Oscillospiraceae bacterium]
MKSKNILISLCVYLTVCILLSGCSIERKKQALSNANAGEMTKAIYNYLCSVEGEKVLSAQQESTWVDSSEYEMNYIYTASGKYPAIRGLDYMDDDFDGVNKRAIDWWQKGGLVTVCWHTGSDFSGAWKEAMDSEIVDWDKALTEGTEENKALLNGMDKAAKALKELKDNGVTVIWRPFHEADGGWFWWGKGGSANFVKLWRMMYDRYTDYWKLDNLIWVQGFSHNGEKIGKWYVGDKYCDIIGADSYDGGAQPELYKTVKKLNTNKPVCFHECGDNPTEEQLKETKWLWFMTWHSEYLIDNNSTKEINALYNSDYVITLDELPEFLKENMTEPMNDTDIITNNSPVYEVKSIIDLTDWLGKNQNELDIDEKYISNDGAFRIINVKGDLFGEECEGTAYFLYLKEESDRYIERIYIFVHELDYSYCLEEFKKLYGKPSSYGEEPYVESLGGAVNWTEYETDDFTARLESASKYDFFTVEFRYKGLDI